MEFLTEKGLGKLIDEEAIKAKQKGVSYINNPSGFKGHLINTGNNAYKVSKLILNNNPNFDEEIVNPEITRTAGRMHDFDKISYGDPWHDAIGAYMILTKGEERELVKGGSEQERKNALKRIARCIASDYSLGWELGDNFPATAKYPVSEGLEEKIEYLQKNLSLTGEELSIEEMTFPTSTEQKIAIYSDMATLGEGLDSVEERLREVIERYRELAKTTSGVEAIYFRRIVEISLDDAFQERILKVCENVEKLAGI